MAEEFKPHLCGSDSATTVPDMMQESFSDHTSDHHVPQIAAMSSFNDPSNSLWKPQYNGRIKSYNEGKGFGFIESEKAKQQFGRDVFIHKKQIDALVGLPTGSEIQFEVELNKNGHPQARNVVTKTKRMSEFGLAERLNECQTSFQVYEIVSQNGAQLNQNEIVLALHQLACSRKFETWSAHVQPRFARLLMDRLMAESPEKLAVGDITRIVNAVTTLEEIHTTPVRKYVFEDLASEIKKHVKMYNPTQVANMVTSLSTLRRTQQEDVVVAEITMHYNQIVVANTGNFSIEEVDVWHRFLNSIVRKDINYYQPGYPTY